jgi:TonB family protein
LDLAAFGGRFRDVALLVGALAATACTKSSGSTPANAFAAPLPECDATELEAESAKLRVSQPSLGPPKQVRNRQPEYPREAKDRQAAGEVAIRYRIQGDGTVGDLVVLCAPDPALAEASIDALEDWEFEPRYMNGAPATFDSIARFTFR